MPFLQRSSYALGLVFICIVAIIWSAASILVQYLYHEQSFDAPFLLTYIGTSLFVVLLPIHRLYEQWVECRGRQETNGTYEHVSMTSLPSCDDNIHNDQDHPTQQLPTYTPTYSGEVDDDNDDNSHNHQHRSSDYRYHWTEHDHRIAAAKIAPVWFISNYAYNASLQFTSITSSTVLANTGSLFSFLFALLMKDENFSCWKLFGVFFGIAGCILTGLHDAGNNEDENGSSSSEIITADDTPRLLEDDRPLWGDTLSFVSAAFYGIYAVMVRVLCPRDESLFHMQLLLGYIGLWNMVFLSPVVIWQVGIAHNTVISAFVFGCLILKGLFDNVLSDYLWARAVVLTSATVATVGLGLTIPLAFVSDVFMGRENVFNFESLVGALAVLTGFVLVNVGQQQEAQDDLLFHGVRGETGGVATDIQSHQDGGCPIENTGPTRHRHQIHHMSLDCEFRTESEGFKDDLVS